MHRDVQRRPRRGWPEGSAQLLDRAHRQGLANHDAANITERGREPVDLNSSVGIRPHYNILLEITLRSRRAAHVVPSAPGAPLRFDVRPRCSRERQGQRCGMASVSHGGVSIWDMQESWRDSRCGLTVVPGDRGVAPAKRSGVLAAG